MCETNCAMTSLSVAIRLHQIGQPCALLGFIK